ncbi:MAG: hypothetical protein DHS20C01_27140 [marine bacterium B5-7]|nr:MAG: hypothetical protein DHS20C01_27140 [marine bacterium B5-7]
MSVMGIMKRNQHKSFQCTTGPVYRLALIRLVLLGTLSATATAELTPTLDLELELESSPGVNQPVETGATPQNVTPGMSDSDLLREGLKRVEWLQKAGAMSLAEQVLINDRPSIEDQQAWIDWERRLWENYKARNQWQKLVARIESLPPELDDQFLFEANTLGVDALLNQREFIRARSWLRRLLLSPNATPVLIAEWRRQILTSYLWGNNLKDANAAMLEYESDYFPDDHRWNILRARTLIQLGMPDRAASQVASVTNKEGTLVGLFARFRAGSMTPNEVISKAESIDEASLDDSLKRERYGLIAQAAQSGGMLPQSVLASEKALTVTIDSVAQPLVTITAGDLVERYRALASRIANDANLLVGDFAGWMEYTEQKLKTVPAGMRAMYSYVGQAASTTELANKSFSKLVESLHQSGLTPVIFELFGEGKPLGGFEMLRGPIGLLLSEEALQAGNVKRAAALSAPITQPPAGTSYFDWRLRQARLAIYAGQIQDGVDMLQSLMDALDHLTEDETDRILQVIFDLQALGRHTQAVPLLERTLMLSSDAARQREILFWLAESIEGSGDPGRAALFFLRSSSLARGNAMWEQSARYRAANALKEAGLIEDARALYRSLLASTQDPGQRELLTRKLQDLWLLENKEAQNSSTPDGS